jgi:pimeloyl-ACP methyl ester carboxylesterase
VTVNQQHPPPAAGPSFPEQIATQLGGWRGMVESAIPITVFIVVNLGWSLEPALAASVGLALALAVVRLAQRRPIRYAINGLFGIGLGAIIAWRTGEARDFYLPGILISYGYAAGMILSVLVRHPLVGWLWSVLMEVNPRAAHALIPDEEIDAVFARLIGIAGSAASCDAGRPVAVPSAVPGFYANQLVSQDQDAVPDPRPGLREVDVPVLVLRGECDYKRWEIAREYRDTFPDATLVYVPGAGHAIDLDEPELYVATVTAFLAGRELPLEPYMGEREPAG